MLKHVGTIFFDKIFRRPWIKALAFLFCLPLFGCGDDWTIPHDSVQFATLDRQIETGIKSYIDRYDSFSQVFYLGDGRRYQRRSGGLGSPLPPIIIGPNPLAYRFKPCWTIVSPMEGLLLIIEMNPGQTTAFPVVAI
jgi:hypothetical protein